MATHNINSTCSSTFDCSTVDCGNCGTCQAQGSTYTCLEDTSNPCDCVRNNVFGTWNCQTTTGCDGDINISISQSGCTATISVNCDSCCGNVDVDLTVEVQETDSPIKSTLTPTVSCGGSTSITLFGTTGQIFVSATASSSSNPEGCTIIGQGSQGYNC